MNISAWQFSELRIPSPEGPHQMLANSGVTILVFVVSGIPTDRSVQFISQESRVTLMHQYVRQGTRAR